VSLGFPLDRASLETAPGGGAKYMTLSLSLFLSFSFYTIWDTFRSGYSLMNLLYAERYVEILRSLIDTWRHDGFYPGEHFERKAGV